MKDKLITALKITLSILFGLFLVWYIYKDLSAQDKADLFSSFTKANYFWIILSFMLGLTSHLSRAKRWIIVLDTMGYKPKLANGFFTVMIGYLANMVLPRAGEVSRCAVMSKYETIPFNKLLGTVLAERVIDMVILLLLTVFVVVFQIDLIGGFVSTEIIQPFKLWFFAKDFLFLSLIMALAVVVILAIVYIIKKNAETLFIKFKTLVLGFSEGFKSVLKLKNPLWFILHTFFIWILYYLMLHVSVYALDETSNVSIMAILSTMVFGAFGIIAVQGGIGAYPVIVSKTLSLYNISLPIGFAFGWIIWTGQTLMIIVAGLISVILIPRFNKKKNE